SRSAVRAQSRRRCRGDSDVAAAARSVALRRRLAVLARSDLLDRRKQPRPAWPAYEGPHLFGLDRPPRVAAGDEIGLTGRSAELDDVIDGAPAHQRGGVL